ncbi:speriolin-like protein [Thalassophryne amazonica]|uniref:speriolin-like protein n=1 Tax=Thalassophryne amazonica TaxID=390379 RepID=UPI001470DF45|nr:speriolin-like protein [Thalassophryne amazonica]
MKPAASSSGKIPSVYKDTLDESEFRRGLEENRDHVCSSPVNFRSFLQNSMHTEAEHEPLPPDTSTDVKDSERLLGEIAFQLDRRILRHIFQGQRRHYGFNLLNIPQKIIEVSTHPLTGKVDEGYQCYLSQRYHDLMEELTHLRYKPTLHPTFSEFIINTYGILKQRPNAVSTEMMDYNHPDFLKKVIETTAQSKLKKDILVLLDCLCYMAQKDRNPLLLY